MSIVARFVLKIEHPTLHVRCCDGEARRRLGPASSRVRTKKQIRVFWALLWILDQRDDLGLEDHANCRKRSSKLLPAVPENRPPAAERCGMVGRPGMVTRRSM